MAESETVVLLGADRTIRRFGEIDARLEDMRVLFLDTFKVLEEREAIRFGELGGRYVATGRLRDSLVSPAGAGAVRRATVHSLEFGSSVFYAGFQVEDPGPETPAGGLKREGHPSAVMEFGEVEAHEAGKVFLEFVVHGGEA